MFLTLALPALAILVSEPTVNSFVRSNWLAKNLQPITGRKPVVHNLTLLLPLSFDLIRYHEGLLFKKLYFFELYSVTLWRDLNRYTSYPFDQMFNSKYLNLTIFK